MFPRCWPRTPSGWCICACFSPARHCWNHYHVGSTVRSLECRMKEHTAALSIGKRQDIPFYAIVRTRGWMNDMVFGPVAFSTLPQCNLQVMEKLVITWSHARLNCPYARHKTSIFDHGSNYSSVSGSTDGTRRMRRCPTVSRRKGLPLTLPPNAWRKFNDYKNELKIVSLYYMANRLANPRQKHWTARVMIRWIAKRKPGLLTVLCEILAPNSLFRDRIRRGR